MHREFQSVKKHWWWIATKEDYERFFKNPFAQGYELLRKIDRYKNRLPSAGCTAEHTWKQLYQYQRDRFSLCYRSDLQKLNLIKRITAGPGGITFDASQSNDYLLKALRFEIAHPSPLACLEDSSGNRHSVRPAKFESREISCRPYLRRARREPETEVVESPWRQICRKRLQITATWEECNAPCMVYLRLPEHEGARKRHWDAAEAFAYFRSFTKDNPPPDFAAYRRQLRRQSKAGRLENVRTLALGLIAHDYSQLPGSNLTDLADWLCKTNRGKCIFKLSTPQLHKAVYDAKGRILRLIRIAEAF